MTPITDDFTYLSVTVRFPLFQFFIAILTLFCIKLPTYSFLCNVYKIRFLIIPPIHLLTANALCHSVYFVVVESKGSTQTGTDDFTHSSVTVRTVMARS